MQFIRKIKLRGCNCKMCRSNWWNRHYHQNVMRIAGTHEMNKKLRMQGKKEAASLGEWTMPGVGGKYYD